MCLSFLDLRGETCECRLKSSKRPAQTKLRCFFSWEWLRLARAQYLPNLSYGVESAYVSSSDSSMSGFYQGQSAQRVIHHPLSDGRGLG